MKNKNLFSLFIIIISFIRLVASTGMGQTVDEAHYVLYGRLLDLSYFDHPPMVGWIHFLFQQLPFNELIKARLPAILISILTIKLIHNYLTQKNVSEKNSFIALTVLNLTPLYNSLSIALLPDTILMPLTVLIVERSEKVLTKSNFKNWLLLGLWLGLAGLTKYTAIVYVIALILLFVLRRKYSELFKPPLWGGVILAVTLISPVLIWNYLHDFASFKYQSGHVLSFDSNLIKSFFSSAFIQLLSWGIGPFGLALFINAVWFKHIRSLQEKFVVFIFLSVFLFFFTYMALSEVLLPHWMLIYFIMMIPLAYSHCLERNIYIPALIFTAATSAMLSIVLLLELAFHVFSPRFTAGLYEGVWGWEEIVSQANKELDQIPNSGKQGLAVMNWTLGSRTMYYNRSTHKVYVLDKRFDQFDIWNGENPLQHDFIVIIEANKKEEHLSKLNCSEISLKNEQKTLIKNVQINHFLYYHCANFLGLKD